MFLTYSPDIRRNRIDQAARDLYAKFCACVVDAEPFDKLPAQQSQAWKEIAACVRFRRRAS